MNPILLPFLLIISQLNSCIEMEMSAPSLLDIANHFQIGEKTVTLTISYNLFAFCLAAFIYGPLSDAYGRRKVMVIGNGILALGAIGCVLAPTFPWLLGTRFIQGIGAATTAVLLSAIVADVYKTQNAAKLYGIMNGIFTSFMAVAPVLGGLLNHWIGWRGNYGFVALTCIIAWFLLLFKLPETKPDTEIEKLQFKKIFQQYKMLVSNATFVCASIVPSLLYGCYLAFVAIAPFLYMKTFGLSMLSFTLNQAIVLVVFTITSFMAGKIIDFFGPERAMYFSLMICLVGTTSMLFADSAYTLTIFMSVYSSGFAILYPIVFASSIVIFPNIKGSASSMIIGMRYFICAGLVSLASYFYNGTPFSLAAVIFVALLLVGVLSLFLLQTDRLNLKSAVK